MPVIAVVAAIGTISSGIAMGGVLGGLMVAGGALSGLGAVTGNKKLAKIGAVLSLGAGIGSALGLAGSANSLANSVTGAKAGDALFAQGSKSIIDVGKDALGAVKDGFREGTSGLPAGEGASISAPPGGAGLNMGPPTLETFNATPLPSLTETTGLIRQGVSQGGLSPSLLPAQPSATELATASGNQSTLGGEFTQDASIRMGSANAAPVKTSEGFLGFMQKNPELIKTGSGLIQGAMGSYSQQQQAAQAQAAADRRIAEERALIDGARKRYNDSISQQQYAAPRSIN